MATLDAILQTLQQIQFFRIALPFLFTFAVVYGAITKTDLFGAQTQRIGGVIGVAAGLFTARFMVISGLHPAALISNYLGAMAVVLIFLMTVLLIRGLTGTEAEDGFNSLFMWTGLLAAAALFAAWGGVQTVFPGIRPPDILITSKTFITLVVVLLAIGGIAYMTSGNGPDQAPAQPEGQQPPTQEELQEALGGA